MSSAGVTLTFNPCSCTWQFNLGDKNCKASKRNVESIIGRLLRNSLTPRKTLYRLESAGFLFVIITSNSAPNHLISSDKAENLERSCVGLFTLWLFLSVLIRMKLKVLINNLKWKTHSFYWLDNIVENAKKQRSKPIKYFYSHAKSIKSSTWKRLEETWPSYKYDTCLFWNSDDHATYFNSGRSLEIYPYFLRKIRAF